MLELKRLTTSLVAALIVGVTPQIALGAKVCYKQPFGNANTNDGWGSVCCGRTGPHTGVDYPQAAGTKIPAIADGVVKLKTTSKCLGNVVVVKHADGMYSSYSHMLAQSTLKLNAKVKQGDAVGRVGASGGCPKGAHLHLSMSKTVDGYASYATTVDPYKYINQHKTCTPDWAATFANASFGKEGTTIELDPGEVRSVWLDFENVGEDTWKPGEVSLGTTKPRDGASLFFSPDWTKPSRPASVDAATAHGKIGRFSFDVTAPTAPGSYTQHLGLVREKVKWFGDDGGPEDDEIEIVVLVKSSTGGAAGAGGASNPGAAGEGGTSAGTDQGGAAAGEAGHAGGGTDDDADGGEAGASEAGRGGGAGKASSGGHAAAAGNGGGRLGDTSDRGVATETVDEGGGCAVGLGAGDDPQRGSATPLIVALASVAFAARRRRGLRR